MRDIIFRPKLTTVPMIYYHIVAWALFITYEVSFAAALRGSYNHLLDYLLHYPLYIALFYIHCYIVLANISFKKFQGFIILITYLLIEITFYYACNIAINNYLISSGHPVNVIDTSSKLFHFATLYRFIYIAALSTALRISLNLLQSQRRNMEYVTETLIHEREKNSLKADLISAELSFLRSQINPHFLFNALSSVYNRIRKKDANSAEYVMALADLMQYALKPQAATDEVPVEDELDHISNYFKLQQMRYSANIILKISNEDRDQKIIPLLLIIW